MEDSSVRWGSSQIEESNSSGWTSFDEGVISNYEGGGGEDERPAGLTEEEEKELTESKEYKRVDRHLTRCEQQVERIVNKAREVLECRGIQISDPEDVRRGVDIYLSDIWDKEPTARLKALKYIVSAGDKPNSRIWRDLIKEINKLDKGQW
ncbi:unnamed protein product [Victoria cruziana]